MKLFKSLYQLVLRRLTRGNVGNRPLLRLQSRAGMPTYLPP